MNSIMENDEQEDDDDDDEHMAAIKEASHTINLVNGPHLSNASK